MSIFKELTLKESCYSTLGCVILIPIAIAVLGVIVGGFISQFDPTLGRNIIMGGSGIAAGGSISGYLVTKMYSPRKRGN